ncbi:hypothetical protein EI94DRAFT_1801344 [Lactarius quietus]|nr:hypothetical protein EI94DRAFT_1801344 [Lactarius quietus]
MSQAKDISNEDVKDLILGTTRQDEFWENISEVFIGIDLHMSKCPSEPACGVPGRRVHSVYDHTKWLYDPYGGQKKWTDVDDLKLLEFVWEEMSWTEIGEMMLCSAHSCCNRYQKQLAHRETWCQGAWSPEEEARLINIMQVLGEEGKVQGQTHKIWKQVSERMDHTRMPEQCRSKWCNSLSPDAKRDRRWRPTNYKILVNKVASLDLNSEGDINWDDLSNLGWNGWSAKKLQRRWAALKAKVEVNGTHRDVVQQLMRHSQTM